MRNQSNPLWRAGLAVAVCGLLWSLWAAASEIQLKDSTVLEGNTAPLKGLTADPKGASPGDPIIVVNDALRRYYVPKGQVMESRAGRVEPLERFVVPQPGKSDHGAQVRTVGPALRTTKWDPFGRRIYTMSASPRTVDVIQCITEITPKYTQVEAYERFKWTQMIATTSIPPDTLHQLIMKSVHPKRLGDRRRVVRFYLQLERFNVAEAELKKVLEEFPEAKEDYQRTLRDLKQLSARRVLDEIKARQAAGQHLLAYTLLKKFPSEGVAGEILAEVDEILKGYDRQLQQRLEVLKQLDAHVRALIAKESKYKAELEAIGKEIGAELSVHTLDRMAAYQTLAADPVATLEQKVALAFSGWSQGTKGATNSLPVALSLYKVRDLVHEYFNADLKLDRNDILKRLRSQEGATPERLAQLLAHMKPPKDTPEPAAGGKKSPRGFYALTTDGVAGGAAVPYYVQLPPEYNPYRRYPAVVTLHGAGTTAPMQVEWWSGSADERGERRGQGARHGYIVIAPAWGEPHQNRYGFTLREHVAVLNSLRDACRRFSIDTDRVFLSGHSMGGTAAWDIALSHPDLFAGVIPIACKCEKYIDLYWENARYVPIYYICGEMDGDTLATSAMSLDRYLQTTPPVNVIVTEFLGRGHEDFSDELLNLFAWMGRHRRNFALTKFTCFTKRPWDNYFWWVEVEGLPEKTVVLPEDWGKKRTGGGAPISGSIPNINRLFVKAGAAKVTLWLTPELVDFNKPLYMNVSGKERTVRADELRPGLEVMLEDVRSRGDRLHPFWAKFVFKSPRD